VLCRYRLAGKNKGKRKKPFVKNLENAKRPEHKNANDQSLLVDSECEGTLLLQRNCGSCNVVFSKKVRQRGTKLTVCAKIMPKVMQGIDLILGMDHLKQFGVKLNCQRDTIEVHTPEAGKVENKKKKYEEKGDLISTIMAMTDAANKKKSAFTTASSKKHQKR
jgi:citrate lyase gamma subunit